MLWGDCRCSRANRTTGAAFSSEIRAGIASGLPDSRCSTRPRLVRSRAPQAPGKPPRLPNAYFPFDVGHVAFMVGHSLCSRGPLWGRRPRRPARAVLDADSVVPAAGRGRPGPEGTPTRGAAPKIPGMTTEIIQSKTMDIAGNTSATRAPGSGSALAGFLVSGFLLALLGAILPAWGYHRDLPDFIPVANYFLSLAIGIVAAARFARPIMLRRGLSFLLVFGCALSSIALLYLALASPPLSDWWRVAGFLVLGAGAGLLNLALFHAISPGYQADAAGTVNKAGIMYGLGCLTATLLVIGAIGFDYSVPSTLIFMALVPGV